MKSFADTDVNAPWQREAELSLPYMKLTDLVRAWNRGLRSAPVRGGRADYTIVHTRQGAKLLHRSHPDAMAAEQGCTPDLIRRILALAVLAQSRPMRIRTWLRFEADGGDGLAGKLPSAVTIADLLRRFATGATVETLEKQQKQRLSEATGEFSHLSVDGTYKILQTTLGLPAKV